MIESLGDGISLITWDLGDNYARKLWINSREGYTPFRLEVIFPAAVPESHANPPYHCDIGYKQINGVWAPVSFVAFDRDRTTQSRSELTIEWQSVNGPVSDDYFTDEALHARPDDEVIDFRLEHPTIVRRIPAAPLAERREPGSARWIFVTVNIVFFLLVGLTLLVRRWMRPKVK
jgi:hypothetical protein